MIRFALVAMVAILSTVAATPARAQAAISEPGLYAFYHPDAGLRLGSTPPSPREAAGTSGAMAAQPLRSERPHRTGGHHHQ
jgi:hypothetical protein